MFESERERYNALSVEYKNYVADKISAEDFAEYNEVLFSAHSCGIEEIYK